MTFLKKIKKMFFVLKTFVFLQSEKLGQKK